MNLPRFNITPTQWTIAGFIVCALILIGITGGAVSSWKDARFEKRQTEYERQLKARETERTAAIARAEMSEKRAAEAEAKSAINEAIAKAAGARAQAAKEQLENEDKRFQEEIASVGDDVDSCTRIKRICQRAKVLRLYPAGKVCACSESSN